MKTVDYNRERWSRLISVARVAACLPTGETDSLRKRADDLRDAPSPTCAVAWSVPAFNTLRWSCLMFAHADVATRSVLGPSLQIIADACERAMTPDARPPGAAAMPAPREHLRFEAPETDPPAWLKRADIGG